MPITTREAPAPRTSSTRSRVRMPPPTWTATPGTGRQDRADDRVIPRAPVARAVEIDDVDAARAGSREAARHRRRVGVVARSRARSRPAPAGRRDRRAGRSTGSAPQTRVPRRARSASSRAPVAGEIGRGHPAEPAIPGARERAEVVGQRLLRLLVRARPEQLAVGGAELEREPDARPASSRRSARPIRST